MIFPKPCTQVIRLGKLSMRKLLSHLVDVGLSTVYFSSFSNNPV